MTTLKMVDDRPRYSTDDRPTPRSFYAELDEEFDFNDDPCPLRGKSEMESGLIRDWGSRTYMNPPYSNPLPWCRKAVTEMNKGKLVVGLLRVDTSTRWFHDFVLPYSEIRWVRGRLNFLEGDDSRPAPFASMVVIWDGRVTAKADDINISMWKTGPPPASGQKQRYPGRFWFNFKKEYPIADEMKVLHMFSGSMDWGDTTDMREETGAKFVAPYDNLPIESDTYDLVVADPPYTCGFANEWIEHPKDLPKPKRILMEAARVTKPGGLIAILHVILVPAYKVAGVSRIGLHGILCGPNNAIRILNVFRKWDGRK